MTAALLSAINILTKPAESVCNAQISQEVALLSAIQANRARLLHHLESDPGFALVQRLRAEVKSEWFPNVEEDDHCWAFIQECFLLMLALTRHLSSELDLFRRIPPPSDRVRTSESAPPLPPDVLSVSQQMTLTAAFQFVVSLGICPYLAPGVGVPLVHRSAFGAVVEKLTHNGTKNRLEGQQRLLTTTKVLLRIAELASLATLIFARHLGDLMAALCQLGYQPCTEERRTEDDKELSAEQRQMCREALKNLLEKVYQPIVIKELLILQGPKFGPVKSSSGGAAQGCAPSWLRRLCGQLLSERLMQPHGVQAVVRAILEGTESDWRKCDGVAKILVTCPQQSTSQDSYYRQVCPQILDMLHFKDKLTAHQFQRVATTAVLSLVQEKSSFAQQYLLPPLLAPLHRCITPSNPDLSKDTVEEWELSQCVDDLYKVCVVGNRPSASLLTSLTEVLPVLFTLFCFTKQNVSHLRAPCQEVMLWYLSHCDSAVALSALKQLSGLKQHELQVAAGFHFCPGGEGGVKLTSRENCSDEDDALFEKLSGEQWKLECLNELLSQLKDSDLPGDFFLVLLQELTCWAAEADAEEEQELDVSVLTLLEVEQRVQSRSERQGQRLALLQVLAAMIECLPHTLLLRKNTQVVGFVVSLLQRACVALSDDPLSSCESPVESQTLSMGMGLVATLLSFPQVSSEDYRCMSHLLSPLDTLSQLHPEVFIQELASNLKTIIATHGAFSPDNLSAPSAQPSSSTDNMKTEKTNRKSSSSRPGMSGNAPVRSSRSEATKSKEGSDYPAKPLSDWFLEACDPDVPTRAVALRGLTRLVQQRDPETLQAQEKILVLFLENLEHEDSFIYLSAIQGLAVLADSFPQRILERLLQDFQRGPSLPTSNRERSLETRLKVGEVLMRASKAMGELAPHLGRPLLGIFLQSTKDPDHSVRASSLSNLGELCHRLDYALGPLAQELSTCLTALIKTEKEAEVRRAAVHVIAQLLKGLSDKTTQVLADVLLELYRALKCVVRSDPDGVTVLHAQLALEELDDVMRKFIFPEQKLEKKIVVLP